MAILGLITVFAGVLWMFLRATSELRGKALWVLVFLPYTLYYGASRLPRTQWPLATILTGMLAAAWGRLHP